MADPGDARMTTTPSFSTTPPPTRGDRTAGLGGARRPLRGARPRLRPARGVRARSATRRRAVVRGARGVRRPVEEPDRHRDAALPRRPGARMRRRGAARRDVRRRARSTAPRTARCCTRRCAHRAAQAPFGAEVHAVLDAMLAFAEAVRDAPTRAAGTPASRRQHRHRRQRPRAADGGAGARRVRAPGPDVPLRRQRRRRRHRPGAAPARRRTRRCSSIASKTFTTQETMANAHDRAARWFVANGGTDIDEHFVAATTNVEAAARSASRAPSASGTGSAGAIRSGRRSACRSRSRSAPSDFRELLAGAHAMDEHFAQAPLEQQPAGAARPDRRLVSQLPPLHEPLRRAVRAGAASACRPTCSSSRWRATASASTCSGAPLPFATSPVVWGEPGTNGQHAYFQMLHQGTDVVPVEFILRRKQPSAGADERRRPGARAPAPDAARQRPGAERRR